jgi:acyl-CoA dehydrogenase
VLNLASGFETCPATAEPGLFPRTQPPGRCVRLLADLSMMLLGGELKRRERLSARLGDVLSNLYLASAALKRYHDLDSPEHMRRCSWAMEESLGSRNGHWMSC